jgi:hypothetical protein
MVNGTLIERLGLQSAAMLVLIVADLRFCGTPEGNRTSVSALGLRAYRQVQSLAFRWTAIEIAQHLQEASEANRLRAATAIRGACALTYRRFISADRRPQARGVSSTRLQVVPLGSPSN